MMSNAKRSWTESITEVLASWGIAPRAATAQRQRAAIQVLGPARDRSEHVLVGTLTNEEGEFVFRYETSYATRDECPALPAFPDKAREYRSRELWPFFDVRLPPLERADIQAMIRAQKVDAGDTLRLLEALGRKSITTPYELRYRAA